MQEALEENVGLYQEYHALLVAVGKRQCKKAAPACRGCPLQESLEEGQPVGDEW
jgi:endonuclease-3 related protein